MPKEKHEEIKTEDKYGVVECSCFACGGIEQFITIDDSNPVVGVVFGLNGFSEKYADGTFKRMIPKDLS